MPFVKQALIELQERLKVSEYGLAVALSGVAERYGLEKKSYTPQTVSNWKRGKSTPSVDALDPLIILARENGCRDLVFYAFGFGENKIEVPEQAEWR